MANALASETSPYLLQHVDNPVAWFPWGERAFELARERDVPVLLSIGYAACHWCHVMAHESFEDEDIAALMNEHFVNVKVDREERPDVDALYMEAVQAMTGRGGWPLTVFLTPEGEPFYGGTYYPPRDRPGMPGFPSLLRAIDQAWTERRDEVSRSAEQLAEAIRRSAAPPATDGVLGPDLADSAAAAALAQIDGRHGGLGSAPKFPNAPALRFLLDHGVLRGSKAPVRAVCAALGAMARGGLRDHLAGGFHRYSVDERWQVPHFEKMLYDNALLGRLYLDAWRATGLTPLRAVAEQTLAWALEEMRGEHGAFLASQDADTADGEGVFYTWTPAEIKAVLEERLAEVALAAWGVTEAGTFEEGRSVLERRRPASGVARELGISVEELEARLGEASQRLAEARAERQAPAVDSKVVVSWNGLMIEALAGASGPLGRPELAQAAVKATRFILGDACMPDGGLSHSWRDGRPGAPGFLEDYAAMGNACLTLYEATFDATWLDEARALLEEMEFLFAASDGGFLRSGARHERLFAQQKEMVDGAEPSGNAQAARLLLRASALLGDGGIRRRAVDVLRLLHALMDKAPTAVGAALVAYEHYLDGPREVAVVGPDPEELLAVVRGRYVPGLVIASRGQGAAPAANDPALLEGRAAVDGQAAAYLCRAFACHAPVTEPQAFRRQLADVAPELDACDEWLWPAEVTEEA